MKIAGQELEVTNERFYGEVVSLEEEQGQFGTQYRMVVRTVTDSEKPWWFKKSNRKQSKLGRFVDSFDAQAGNDSELLQSCLCIEEQLRKGSEPQYDSVQPVVIAHFGYGSNAAVACKAAYDAWAEGFAATNEPSAAPAAAVEIPKEIYPLLKAQWTIAEGNEETYLAAAAEKYGFRGDEYKAALLAVVQ